MSNMRDTSDAQLSQGEIQQFLALLGVFNGTTYDRVRGAGDNADALASITLGVQRMLGMGMVYNGATWDRLRSAVDNADAAAVASTGLLGALARGQLFNGASWDRVRGSTVFKQLNAVAVGSEVTIWTPTAGKKFRLMGFIFSSGTAAGNIALKDNTAGSTIYTVPKTGLDVAFNAPPMGNGILSAVANNVLTATGVATQTLSGVVFGTEE